MTTRTIYIVPARQTSLPLASSAGGQAPARQFTISRHVPISIRQQPVATTASSLQPRTATIVPHSTILQPVTSTSCRPTAVTLPQKRSASVALEEPSIDELLGFKGGDYHAVRKRERLNHLTSEEKLNRRKLKNRVAAQTARDRKKVRTQKLEDAIRKLVAENEAMRAENKRVNEVCEQLKTRNAELEKMLLKETKQERQVDTNDVEGGERRQQSSQCSIESSFGSAESIRGPQPREQATPVQAATLLLLSFLASTCKKSSTTCSKMTPSLRNSAPIFSTVNLTTRRRRCATSQTPFLLTRRSPRKSAARLEWIPRLRISI